MVRYLVLGYGAMGQIIIKDLFETASKNSQIVVAGRNLKKAKAIARSYKGRRVSAKYADVTKPKSMVRAFKGADVVIHAVHHEFNVAVMKACLQAGCDYTDLGGLFHWVKPQLKLHKQFKKKGLTAAISCGAAPGIENIMAHYAADQLDRVSEIHLRIGVHDETKVLRSHPLSAGYSIETIFQEFSYRPAVLTKGKIKFVEPMSGRDAYTFPKPVGTVKPMYTIHSEIAELAYALKKKGLRECDFKISFDDDFVYKVRFLRDLGMLSENDVKIKGCKIKPRDYLSTMLKKIPPAKFGKSDEYEIIRADVIGKKRGKNKRIIMDCHVLGMPKWGIGIDLDTGGPASIVAQFLARGLIRNKGVYPPGMVVPHAAFFKELAKRRMFIYQNGRKLNLNKIKHVHGVH